MKIKLKDGLKIESAIISYNCPIYSVSGDLKMRKNIAKFPYNCPNGEPCIYIKAKNKNGDTLTINNQYLNNYNKKKKIISKCKCYDKQKRSHIGLLKIRHKYLYKKYTIHKDDFEINGK